MTWMLSLIVVLWALPAGRARAQDRLVDLLREAGENNPRILAVRQDWNAQHASTGAAGALPEPVFMYTYFIEPVETRVGPQRQRFALAQQWPWFGKRSLQRAVSRDRADQARAAMDAARESVFHEIVRTWSRLYFLQHMQEVLQTHVDLLHGLEQVSDAEVRTGDSALDLYEIQIEQSDMAERLRRVREQLDVTGRRLNRLAGRPEQSDYPIPGALDLNLPATSRAQLRQMALENNPALQQQVLVERQYAKQERLARLQSWPDLQFRVDYIQTDPARMQGVSDSGKDPILATAGLNIPLWWNKYRAQRAAARSARAAAQFAEENIRNRILNELDQALFEYDDAVARGRLYDGDLVPQARRAYEVARRDYTTGRIGFERYVSAQRRQLNFEIEQERARAERAESWADVMRITAQLASYAEEGP
jgi:outer membrane protein TolC